MNVKEYILVPRSVYESLVNTGAKKEPDQVITEPEIVKTESVTKPSEIEDKVEIHTENVLKKEDIISQEHKNDVKTPQVKVNKKNRLVKVKKLKHKAKVSLQKYDWIPYQ